MPRGKYPDERVDVSTQMTPAEMKAFVRNHFEEFVNRKNLNIADANFAPQFLDHGSDVPPGLASGPAGAKQYVGNAHQRFPDLHVEFWISSPRAIESRSEIVGPERRPRPAPGTSFRGS